jgi:hypothetical protein
VKDTKTIEVEGVKVNLRKCHDGRITVIFKSKDSIIDVDLEILTGQEDSELKRDLFCWAEEQIELWKSSPVVISDSKGPHGVGPR